MTKLTGNTKGFLRAYCDNLEWGNLSIKEIAWRLCQEGIYSKDHGHSFLKIAYGWIWGKTDDEGKANCETAILYLYMNEIYEEVAYVNNWDLRE